MTYTPDRWVVISLNTTDGTPPTEHVLGGWYGGYLGSDSWRRSSAIQSHDVDEEGAYVFQNVSGSTYRCFPSRYGLTGLTGSVLHQMKDEYEIVPRFTPDSGVT
jgi:hypothetical protein